MDATKIPSEYRVFLFDFQWATPRTLFFHTLYRPPNVSKADFIEEFSTFVECAALTCSIHPG